MMNFRGFIGLILLGICVLFVVQNLQPISLVFFGGNPVTLPLSIWIVLFTGAGLISSLIIQTLNKVISSSSISDNVPQQPLGYSPPSPSPSPPPTSPTTTLKNIKLEEKPSWDNYSLEKINSRSEDVNIDKINNLGADRKLDKSERDWREQKEIREDKQEAIESNQEDANFEVEQNLQTLSRPASLYSYKSRERTQIRRQLKPKSKPKSKPKDEVYDADYRVITPPYRDKDQPKNEDEEWDF